MRWLIPFLKSIPNNPLPVFWFTLSSYANNVTDPFVPNLSHDVDTDPFLESLSLVPKDLSLPLSSKGFRVFCTRSSQTPSGSTCLRFHSWTRFWDILLSHCRDAWFHLLHDKLLYPSLLHRLTSSAWPESCPFCRHPRETMDHVLFLCLEKLTVWISICQTYFGEHTFFRRPCPLCTASTSVSSFWFPFVYTRSWGDFRSLLWFLL